MAYLRDTGKTDAVVEPVEPKVVEVEIGVDVEVVEPVVEDEEEVLVLKKRKPKQKMVAGPASNKAITRAFTK